MLLVCALEKCGFENDFNSFCGVECVSLLTNPIKSLGMYFSYNEKLENGKNFLDYITKL